MENSRFFLVLVDCLCKNEIILTSWTLDRVLNENENNLAEDYLKHITRSVNFAFKNIQLIMRIDGKKGKRGGRKKKKSRKKCTQKGGNGLKIFFLLLLAICYAFLSYDQHMVLKRTLKDVENTFFDKGREALQNGHPHLARVYAQIAKNPFGGKCQKYNPRQLEFISSANNNNNAILPRTQAEQIVNSKKALETVNKIYKNMQDRGGVITTVPKGGLGGINYDRSIECHVSNIASAILAETQEIIDDVIKEIGPVSNYDTAMNLIGLFMSPNNIDTHLDNSIRTVQNLNLRFKNRATDAEKLRNNMTIIFNRINILIKNGSLRIGTAYQGKRIIQTIAFGLLTGTTQPWNAMLRAPKAFAGMLVATSAIDATMATLSGSDTTDDNYNGPNFERSTGGKTKKRKRQKRKKSRRKRK